MTHCTCDICRHKLTPCSLGQCHGYTRPGPWEFEPCTNDATPGDLLCIDHARVQSQAVRSICRGMAPKVRT